MTLRSPAATAALLVGIGLGVSCGDTQEGADRYTSMFPLFSHLEQAKFDQSCDAFRDKQRASGGELMTHAPEAIHWAKDIHDAVERATAEDKPIFLVTFVNQNGDPACDV